METKNNNKGDKSPPKPPQKENLSPETILKLKKKKIKKKGKIKNKKSEEVPSLEHAHGKKKENTKENEGLPKKPTEKGPLKRKSCKNNIDKPLCKKAKRKKSSKQLRKGDKSVDKSTTKRRGRIRAASRMLPKTLQVR